MEVFGKSFSQIIEERITSPLVSGFLISWTIINWKFLVILFSDNTVSKTIELADALYPIRLDWWGWNVAAPIASSLFYVYVVPLFSRPVHKKWRENQQNVEDDRMDAAKVERISSDASHALRVENFDFRKKVRVLDAERAEAVTARELAETNAAAADQALALERSRADEAAKLHAEAVSQRNATLGEGARGLQTIMDMVQVSQQLLEVLALGPKDKASHVSPVEWEVLNHLWRSGIVSQEDFSVWNLRALTPALKSELPADGRRLAIRLADFSVEQEMELEDRGFISPDEGRLNWRLTDKGEAVFKELQRFDKILDTVGGEELKKKFEEVGSRAGLQLLDNFAAAAKARSSVDRDQNT